MEHQTLQKKMIEIQDTLLTTISSQPTDNADDIISQYLGSSSITCMDIISYVYLSNLW
jgi:hypothetical protein